MNLHVHNTAYLASHPKSDQQFLRSACRVIDARRGTKRHLGDEACMCPLCTFVRGVVRDEIFRHSPGMRRARNHSFRVYCNTFRLSTKERGREREWRDEVNPVSPVWWKRNWKLMTVVLWVLFIFNFHINQIYQINYPDNKHKICTPFSI